MEKWRVCPECGSENIYCDIGVTPRVDKFSAAEDGNRLVIEDGWPRPKVANIDIFVCADCGNIRSYVSDDSTIELIKESWRRADSMATYAGSEFVIRRVMSNKRRRNGTNGE